ncbi:MAG: M55 family metallopeptidase [Armatimonadetes bacterium]|nr:M55 family metallopeptidase [Armatimonadota bacterium]
MKVFISADIEGCTGLVSWSQCGRPNSDHYDYAFARRMMTNDVNAAIRGAKAGGADLVLVKDSHGNSKNLLIDELEPGTQLISGFGARQGGMMIGIDRTFNAAMLIGYHAMAGTPSAIMEHTLTGYVHRMWINGMPAGEIALSTALAGCFDVPVVTVSSDEAGCEEAEHLIKGVKTARVKQGFGRYMGKVLHPEETADLIYEAAKKGCEESSALDPWLPDLPATVRIEFNRSEEADAALTLLSVRRIDGYTVEYTGDSWAEVHQAAWKIIHYASQGHNADR